MSGTLLHKWGAALGHLFILFLGALTRVRVRNGDYLENWFREGRPFLIATWHGKLLLPVYYYRGRNIVTMISTHRDGELIARVVRRLGYATSVRGSSRRGGNEAYHGMLGALKAGRVGAIQPDGPTGPRHRAKKGVVLLAREAGVPVVPMTFNSSRRKVFSSWDRFTIWLPFSRSCLWVGDPLFFPPDESLEQGILRVEEALNKLEQHSEENFSC